MHQLRMFLLCVLMAAAVSCGEEPETCEDAGLFPGWGWLKPLSLPTGKLPLSSCLTNQRTRADYPNHVQLTTDGILNTLDSIEVAAMWDAETDSLWLRFSPSPSQGVSMTLEVDASALPEAQPQELPLDLRVSGRSSGRWNPLVEEISYDRGPDHSPAIRALVRRLLLNPSSITA